MRPDEGGHQRSQPVVKIHMWVYCARSATVDVDKTRPLQKAKERSTSLPRPGERVIVQCRGFRCLAYRDANEKWKDAATDQELPEVLEVLIRF